MKRFSRALLLALPIALTACGQSTPDATSKSGSTSTEASVAKIAKIKASMAEIPAVQAPNLAAAGKYATGFDTGNLTSARQVFVFFDPQCPHCGMFWEETKQLAGDARFTWVPVGILNRASINQGAAILASNDPVVTMDAHEKKLRAAGGGMEAGVADAEYKAIIERNTRLMESFGAVGVPFIIGANAQTGAVYSESRGMPAAKLASALGWSAGAK
jgi:thiol:disulfide interchange protein DsbG